MVTLRYTSADLDRLPDIEGIRYEIIDGELLVSKTPHAHHQYPCAEISYALQDWNHHTGAGMTYVAPGLVFAEDQDVIPDVVWISRARKAIAMDESGHFRLAPELVIEVLSIGAANARRDRELKLRLYARQGVLEYWILDWRARAVSVHRRHATSLRLAATLSGDDVLTSPLLPGFTCAISTLWDPTATE